MPKHVQYTMTTADDVINLTVYRPEDMSDPFQADNTGSHWDEILAKTLADDPAVFELIRPLEALERTLVSERIAVGNGRVYFDGDEVSTDLSGLILDLVASGDTSFTAFANFMEKLYTNPLDHAVEHLYSHVQKYNVTLFPDGDLLLYKGLNRRTPTDDDPSEWESGTAGPAIVSGHVHKEGEVPQQVGDVVELPRSEINKNPHTACSAGLHVATWGFFHNGYNTTFVVKVNPRDVVSVPHDDAKLRCCRYKLCGYVSGPVAGPVAYNVDIPPIPVASFTDVAVEIATEPSELEVAESPAPAPESPVIAQNVNIDLQAAEKALAASDDPVESPFKHPGSVKFAHMRQQAKSQKKGLVRFATSKGWRLVEGDGSKRSHWSTV